MKNIVKYLGTAVAVLALAVACEPKEPVVEVTPEFPSVVENNNVLPGETLTLSFVPNMDWTVRIPEESIKWYSIIDGTFETDFISGKASETPVEVKVKVSEVEEFDSARVCEITLTMGGETKVIAKFSRQPKERTIAVFTAEVNGDEFVFGGEDGGYVYSEQEAESVDLLWPEGTSGFRMQLKVDANFAWTVATPEWAEANIPESTLGLTTFEILGVPAKYPLDGDQGKIVFKAGETVVKELPVTIPGCRDRFEFALGVMSSLNFNGDGEYRVELGYEAAPAYGTIYGPEGVSVVAVDKTENGYAAAESDWVHVKIADWDPAGDVLQTRSVEYTVDVNEGEYREALVIGLPATFTGSVADLFSGSELKEEYAANSVLVTQDAVSNEYVTPLSAKVDRESVGFFFENITTGPILNWFGQTDCAYHVIYSVAWSLDEGWLSLKQPYHSYKVFNDKRAEQSTEDFWLTIESTENKRAVRVSMNVETKTDGYVAFYDVDGNTLAVLKCTFDPDYTPVIGDEFRVEFIGESAMYAEMVGATLEEVTEGKYYDAYKEYNAPIYCLTYKMENFPMRISLPQGTVFYSVNPYMYRDLFMVNGASYDETGGSFSFLDGGVDIYMSLNPDKPESLVNTGTIMFSRERFNTTDKLTLILVCTLDLGAE